MCSHNEGNQYNISKALVYFVWSDTSNIINVSFMPICNKSEILKLNLKVHILKIQIYKSQIMWFCTLKKNIYMNSLHT